MKTSIMVTVCIMLFLFLVTLLYGGISFVTLEINPLKWEKEVRLFFYFMSLGAMVLSFIYYPLFCKKKEKL